MLDVCSQMHKDGGPEKPRAAITHEPQTHSGVSKHVCPHLETQLCTHPPLPPPPPSQPPPHRHLKRSRPPSSKSSTWGQMRNRSRPLFTALTCEEAADRRVSHSGRPAGRFGMMQRVTAPAVTYLPSRGEVCVRACVRMKGLSGRAAGRAKIAAPSHISQRWGTRSTSAVWHFSTDCWPAPS